MRFPDSARLLTASILSLGLLGLAACGPGDEDQASEDRATQTQVEDATADGGADEMAGIAAEDGEEAAGDVSAEDLPGMGGEVATQGPTSAMSHDGDDTGEDLYQRGFYAEAIDQWTQDAEAGDAYAAYRLGVEYYDGQIVPQDLEMAARYQQLAADLGSAAGMFELASNYEDGTGVEQNVAEAARWYLASAERGYPPSQHNVATMYEDGVGMPRDLVQAYVYYSLAVEQGFRVNFVQDEETGEATFIDPRDRLRGMMTAEQIAAAEAALAAWTPVE